MTAGPGPLDLPPGLTEDLDRLGLRLGLGGPGQGAWTAPGFIPPPQVAAAASRGLDLRARHGRGGTAVGLARARALSGGTPQSLRDMRVMAGWFARFAYLRRTRGWADPARPSAGYIAWQLWGGDAGRAWVERLRTAWSSGQAL